MIGVQRDPSKNVKINNNTVNYSNPKRFTGRGTRPDRVGNGHSAGSKERAPATSPTLDEAGEGGEATSGEGTVAGMVDSGEGMLGGEGDSTDKEKAGLRRSTVTVEVLPDLSRTKVLGVRDKTGKGPSYGGDSGRRTASILTKT